MNKEVYPVLYYEINQLTPEMVEDIFNKISKVYPSLIMLPRTTELVYFSLEELEEVLNANRHYINQLIESRKKFPKEKEEDAE